MLRRGRSFKEAHKEPYRVNPNDFETFTSSALPDIFWTLTPSVALISVHYDCDINPLQTYHLALWPYHSGEMMIIDDSV